MILNQNINDKEDENNLLSDREKSHWKKYETYYLIFGSFFLALLFIFITNYSTNKEVKRIYRQLIYSNSQLLERLDALEEGRSPGRGGGHGGQASEFHEPDQTRKKANWVDEVVVQKAVNKKVKKWINCFKILPFYLTQNQELDKHVLFCGPPGCGKSFIAEEFCHNETCGFTLAHFETQLYVGSSIEKQQRVFNRAKELLKQNATRGEKKPIAIVIEEIDSVGTKDFLGGSKSDAQEVDGILKIFDEINRENLNIIIIATTNDPEVLNPALVRPGRLGRRIYIDYPTDEETEKLIKYLRKVMEKNWRKMVGKGKLENGIVEWSDNYWNKVHQFAREIQVEFRKKKEGFSFRDLQKAVVNSLESVEMDINSKIIPDPQDFNEDLRDTLQTRVNDRENNPRNQRLFPFFPYKFPDKPEETPKENPKEKT